MSNLPPVEANTTRITREQVASWITACNGYDYVDPGWAIDVITLLVAGGRLIEGLRVEIARCSNVSIKSEATPIVKDLESELESELEEDYLEQTTTVGCLKDAIELQFPGTKWRLTVSSS